MAQLWKKNSPMSLHPTIESYTVGSDMVFDEELLPFDIKASKAHANMLESINIVTLEENNTLQKGLDTILGQWKNGEIKIRKEDEDCHTVIENLLIAEYGEVGKKIHTGRSRNDQVLVAVRLLMKDRIEKISNQITTLQEEFLKRAKAGKKIPFPGYTHTQQAMLSSLGHYFASFAESLENDNLFLQATKNIIDQNPLGSAAGYGVSIGLDREMTTRELGFAKVQVNSIYCQQSRGKFESMTLEALVQIMMTLGKYASDMLLYTSQEFNFFTASNAVVTGSSIMPQKRNLDGLEILRGNTSVIIAKQMEIKEIAKNLISGYHRDLQLLKKPLFEAFHIVSESIEVAQIYLLDLEANREIIEKKIAKEMFLADIANDLVEQKNIPFRDAYVQAFDHLDGYEVDFEKNITSKISLGAPGNLGV